MNHAVHRRSHEALMRKRRAEEAEKRQFDFPIFTDPFPPIFPGRPRPTPDPPVIIEEPPIVIRPTPTPPTVPTRPPPVIIEDPETSSTPSGILISTRSSSSSSALPTTSSTPSAVPTTSSTPPPPPPPAPVTSARETESEKLPLVTITSYVRSSSAGAAAASGTVEAAGSTASAPAIAGGVMGGLVGLGAIAFFVVFLLRRRKQRDQDMSFDPYDFRRSAMQVPEPKDFNDGPPPSGGQPQMTERALPMTPHDNYSQYNNNNADYGYNNNQHPQMSPYPQGPAYHSYGDASPGGNMAGYGAGNMAGAGAAQWAPGQIITSSPGMASHYALNPFMNPAPYNESPFTPTGSPGPYPPPHAAHNAASRAPPPGPIQIDTAIGGANLARTPSTPSTASTSHYPVGFPISPVEGSGKSLSRAPSLSRSRSRTGTNNLSRSNTLNNGGGHSTPDGGKVLAEIGGAAVLTRTTSQKSSHEGHHKKDLSIAVPAPFNVHNIQAINTPTSAALPPHTQPHHHHLLSAPSRADADAPVTAQTIDSDYVDLTRASVSPFQAAQYAEISKRLNTDVPSGMEVTPPMLEQYVVSGGLQRELPPLPPPSPLAPAQQSLYPAAVVAVGGAAAKVTTPPQARVRDSKDGGVADLTSSFPIPPPSPLVPPPSFGTSPTRVDSRPPRLPEIAFRNSTASGMGMSSGWVDTPPSSLQGHGDDASMNSPISPVSPQRGKAESSLGHGTTFEYHKSFTGAPSSHGAMMSLGGGLLGGEGREEKEVGPAFPSGISALGGLASPMNSRFNLGMPPAPQAPPQAPSRLTPTVAVPAAAVPAVAQPTRVENIVPPSPTTSSLPSTRVSSTSTVVADDQAQVQPKKEMVIEKSPLKSELVVVGGVEGDEGGVKGGFEAQEEKKRPETVYDYEDAYGGF